VEHELLTFPEAPEFTSGFSGVRVARSLFFCVVFCRLFFVLLSFFVSTLCCLSLDVLILVAPLVFSNYSYLSVVAYNTLQGHLSEWQLTLYNSTYPSAVALHHKQLGKQNIIN
jgi:hypothetical protein